MKVYILEFIYVIASVLFILGLKMLSHPDSARKGNLWAGFGMGLAIFATIFLHTKEGQPIGNHLWIAGGLLVGTTIGWLMAMRVKMTAMPQMVSFFNGMGGACAALISMMEFPHVHPEGGMFNGEVLSILAGLMIVGGLYFDGPTVEAGTTGLGHGELVVASFVMLIAVNLVSFTPGPELELEEEAAA